MSVEGEPKSFLPPCLTYIMKKITLDCYTSNAGIHELFPISLAKRHIPQWFKNIPSVIKQTNRFGVDEDISTLKRCDAFAKLYNNGWTMPLWSDLIVETGPDDSYRYSTVHSGISAIDDFGGGSVECHSTEQLGNAFEDYVHIKIIAPWVIREKTGVDFYFCENTWGIKEFWDDIKILPGILNFKDQCNAHVNMLIKRDRKITFEANTPLIYCVPVSEAQLEIKNHLATDQEYKHLKQSMYGFSFTGSLKKRLKLKK